MKARQGFVSNSSSSSFVVIGETGNDSHEVKSLIMKGEVTLGNQGRDDFGWGPETIQDVFSRINFAKIQAENNTEWLKMLERVIKDEIGCDTIVWEMSDYPYIDHQSNASEGENTEIFDSDDSLRRFLFCSDSLIELDHDNH